MVATFSGEERVEALAAMTTAPQMLTIAFILFWIKPESGYIVKADSLKISKVVYDCRVGSVFPLWITEALNLQSDD